MRIAVAIVCAMFFSAAAFAGDAPPELTVTQIKTSPPIGTMVHVLGIVVGSYVCPPCPEGAMCKPCMSDSSVSISDAPDGPQIAIAVSDPAQFARGAQYRFEIMVGDLARDGVNGRVLRSQRPNDGDNWTTPAR